MTFTKTLLSTAVSTALAVAAVGTVGAATINQTLVVRSLNKTMSDGASVTFWGYTTGGMNGSLPGPAIEVGTYPAGSGLSDTLNLTLNIDGMTLQENSPYNGHTIHLHGADVATGEDGVPETGAAVNSDTYT